MVLLFLRDPEGADNWVHLPKYLSTVTTLEEKTFTNQLPKLTHRRDVTIGKYLEKRVIMCPVPGALWVLGT